VRLGNDDEFPNVFSDSVLKFSKFVPSLSGVFTLLAQENKAQRGKWLEMDNAGYYYSLPVKGTCSLGRFRTIAEDSACRATDQSTCWVSGVN